MKAEARTHELKTWPNPFTAIARGEKSWEFRLDDRGYAEGDTLELREWDPHAMTYTGRRQRARVTYIMRGGFGLPLGHVIMSVVPEWDASAAAEYSPFKNAAIGAAMALAAYGLLGLAALVSSSRHSVASPCSQEAK